MPIARMSRLLMLYKWFSTIDALQLMLCNGCCAIDALLLMLCNWWQIGLYNFGIGILELSIKLKSFVT